MASCAFPNSSANVKLWSSTLPLQVGNISRNLPSAGWCYSQPTNSPNPVWSTTYDDDSNTVLDFMKLEDDILRNVLNDEKEDEPINFPSFNYIPMAIPPSLIKSNPILKLCTYGDSSATLNKRQQIEDIHSFINQEKLMNDQQLSALRENYDVIKTICPTLKLDQPISGSFVQPSTPAKTAPRPGTNYSMQNNFNPTLYQPNHGITELTKLLQKCQQRSQENPDTQLVNNRPISKPQFTQSIVVDQSKTKKKKCLKCKAEIVAVKPPIPPDNIPPRMINLGLDRAKITSCRRRLAPRFAAKQNSKYKKNDPKTFAQIVAEKYRENLN